MAPGHHHRHPRPLVLDAFGVTFLMLFGTLVYRATEGLSWVDSLYLACTVVTTVGLGNGPQTPIGKMFTVVYNVASLGLGVLLVTEIADWRRERWRRRLRTSGSAWQGHDIAALLAATAPAILGAALIFQWIEDWDFFDSLYFSLVTATGLGLVDREPQKPSSRVIFVAYMFYVMGTALHLLGAVGNVLHERRREATADGGLLDSLRSGSARASHGAGARLAHASGSAAFAAADRERVLYGRDSDD
jgi:hypothetical protein